jgi:hypothetical protein
MRDYLNEEIRIDDLSPEATNLDETQLSVVGPVLSEIEESFSA